MLDVTCKECGAKFEVIDAGKNETRFKPPTQKCFVFIETQAAKGDKAGVSEFDCPHFDLAIQHAKVPS